jgi:hypothetical protein
MRRVQAGVALTLLLAVGCGQQQSAPPEETMEQYAKNPVGCEPKRPEWYTEQVQTKEGQDELRRRIKSYTMRGDYHGRQMRFTSLSEADKVKQAGTAVTCYTEVKWALETLAKAGLEAIKER